jgi:hypothetical protein
MFRIVIAAVLSCTSMLAGCEANTTSIDTTAPGPAQVEQTGATEAATVESMVSTDYGEETVGEAQQSLTQWQKVCVLGCTTFAGAGCAAVGVSCTAGTLWSFGGILIPCSYAVVAACAGATSVITVCGIKCVGG